jgi:nanoRNase/pAp phosphatase (c-di-AMP/oligoRNAs hydrolase)
MLKYFQQALRRHLVRHNRIYAFLGPVPTPDILVILADFFLRIEEISWTIVGGFFEDKLIVIFRNDGLGKNAGALAGRAFGKLGSAGGHVTSARAEIPLENCKDRSAKDEWQQWQDFIIHRVESVGRLKIPKKTG